MQRYGLFLHFQAKRLFFFEKSERKLQKIAHYTNY